MAEGYEVPETPARAMSDPVALARLFCERVPHSRDLGIEILSLDGPQTRMRLAPLWYLMDADASAICSSVLFSLADAAAGLAVFGATRTLTPIATLDLRMNYLRPAPADRGLVADAHCLAVTGDVAFVHCQGHVEGSTELLATGDATFMCGTRGRRFDDVASARPSSVLPPQATISRPNPNSRGDGYAQHLGIELLDAGGGLRFRLPFRHALVGNAQIPALHGGVLGGLIEEAAQVAVQSDRGGKTTARILNTDIDYHRSAQTLDTHASVEVVRRTRRTALAQVVCWQAEHRKPVATGRVQMLLLASADEADSPAAEAAS
ncbi:MAG: PaaI family thioesterase [Nevskia sp.]|nr:PaaI family thioesterase [Nevskia sp.]